jgi:hypothetical protein
MNRRDLQRLANARIVEAKALLVAGHYSGAYHLAGLAVECALKACIAKRTKAHTFPDKNLAAESYSHDLTKLRRLADLDAQFLHDAKSDPALVANWTVVKDWAIESRYETKTAQQAKDLYDAVYRRQSGVLRWIRRRW